MTGHPSSRGRNKDHPSGCVARVTRERSRAQHQSFQPYLLKKDSLSFPRGFILVAFIKHLHLSYGIFLILLLCYSVHEIPLVALPYFALFIAHANIGIILYVQFFFLFELFVFVIMASIWGPNNCTSNELYPTVVSHGWTKKHRERIKLLIKKLFCSKSDLHGHCLVNRFSVCDVS